MFQLFIFNYQFFGNIVSIQFWCVSKQLSQEIKTAAIWTVVFYLLFCVLCFLKLKLIYRLQEISLSTKCNIVENARRSQITGNVQDNNVLDVNVESGNIEDQDKYEEVICDCTNCQAKHPCLLKPNITHDYIYEY